MSLGILIKIKMKIKNVYIIGLGVIGAAIAKQIKTNDKNINIYGYDLDAQKTQILIENTIIHNKITINEALNLPNCYTIIALDVENTIQVLQQINTLCNANLVKEIIISDTSSVKNKIFHFVNANCHNIKNHFISIHPMFGGRVVKNASDIVTIQSQVLCYIINLQFLIEYTKIVEDFCQNVLKMQIQHIAEDKHDIQMANTSHLAHWLANLFYDNQIKITKKVEDIALQMKENKQLWDMIFKENENNIQIAIKKFLKLLNLTYQKEQNFAQSFEQALSKIANGNITPSIEKLLENTKILPKELPNIFNSLIKEYQ
ncbi:MAG: hypothetical protein RL208_301 [Pseudomonadota bacterium]